MWLFYALLTPLFWSVVHVMDSHCVDEVFEKPWMGMITSALTSTVVIVFLPFILPYIDTTDSVSLYYIGLAVLAGVFIQLSQFFYFQSLANSEAGIVAAYWNLTPAILPMVSYFLFRDVLSMNQYVGIGLLIMTSVGFCLIDGNIHARWNTFFMMLIASGLQVTALLIEDHVFDHVNYLTGFFFITLGLIIAGVMPLFIPHVFKVFMRNMRKLSQAMHILFGIEIINLCALATSQKAIALGNPSLVAAVETSVPAYTFVLSILLIEIVPRLGDPEALGKLGQKIIFVVVMIFGVWLIQN